MKVHELIEILQDMDADADVWLMTQQNYPYAERGIMRSAHRRERCRRGSLRRALRIITGPSAKR